MSNSDLIAVSDIEDKIDHTKPLEEKVLQSMKAIQDHWLVTDENKQFIIAIASVMTKATDEEKTILKDAMDLQRILAVPSSGVDGIMLINMMTNVKIDLPGIWKKAKEPPEPKGGFILD